MSGVFISQEQFEQYVSTHFQEVTQELLKGHIIKFCPGCQTKLGFKITGKKWYYHQAGSLSNKIDSVVIQCPECSHHAIWILYHIENANGAIQVYRLVALPGESAYDIPTLPDEPPALKKAYNEATRSLEANKDRKSVV